MPSIYWVSHIFLQNYQVLTTDTFLWDYPGVKHKLPGHLDGAPEKTKVAEVKQKNANHLPSLYNSHHYLELN